MSEFENLFEKQKKKKISQSEFFCLLSKKKNRVLDKQKNMIKRLKDTCKSVCVYDKRIPITAVPTKRSAIIIVAKKRTLSPPRREK